MARRDALAGAAIDPRLLQIATLGGLLTAGMAWLGFDQQPEAVAVIALAALATEWLGRRLEGRAFDPLSPLITALSLAILLRATSVGYLGLAAMAAVGSKFVLRIGGRHIFNPANLAIALMIVGTDCAWISPGQWGAAPSLGFAMAALAALVLGRVRRVDTALAFLAAWAAIALGRAWWLGDPLAIPMRQMQSGGLLLFAFFMITDPRTTPDGRAARLCFAVLVAILAAWIKFALWKPEALIYALALASPLVALLNLTARRRGVGAPRLQWTRPVVE